MKAHEELNLQRLEQSITFNWKLQRTAASGQCLSGYGQLALQEKDPGFWLKKVTYTRQMYIKKKKLPLKVQRTSTTLLCVSQHPTVF